MCGDSAGSRRRAGFRAGEGTKTIQRVAVLGLPESYGEKRLDPYTVGISETLSTSLGECTG